ncbi:unnamed protein product [Lactuca virosa]|uniref:Uncharacterized protein n=1 Tax=Lactuca virosa TaxID=75947 RepID=A0AAU9M5Z1_9ASTR|nr:unnamed protein product [Lactuca virosa]
MESDSVSDHDEDSKQRGPMIKSKANKAKLVITYNKKGVPVGNEATKLSTFEGLVTRIMVPITYASWLEVSDETKDELWQYVLMQETGKTKEEIDRSMLWKEARELKIGGYDSNVKMIVDRIDELQKSGSFGEVTCGTHDVLTEALGTEEQHWRVRGMGASCQIWGNIEDFENEPLEESLDNSCLIAVDIASNVVAKGTIMKYSASNENIQVMMEIPLQGEALPPIPLE